MTNPRTRDYIFTSSNHHIVQRSKEHHSYIPPRLHPPISANQQNTNPLIIAQQNSIVEIYHQLVGSVSPKNRRYIINHDTQMYPLCKRRRSRALSSPSTQPHHQTSISQTQAAGLARTKKALRWAVDVPSSSFLCAANPVGYTRTVISHNPMNKAPLSGPPKPATISPLHHQ